MPDPETRILALATEMAGSAERAASWFRSQRIPGWNKTAQELVQAGKAERVLEYLISVRAGVYA
jgi:hypothetical protein